MHMNPFDNAGVFLVQAIFDLYIFIVMLRIVLQWVHADFANPIFELVAKLTNKPLRFIRRFVPVINGIDLPAMILLLSLEVFKLILIVWLQANTIPGILGLIVLGFAELLSQLISIFFYSLLGLAILSWVNPLAHGALVDVLYRLCEPLLRPVRRVLPPVAGFDLSPIPVMLGLKLVSILLVQPLIQIGTTLAIGN